MTRGRKSGQRVGNAAQPTVTTADHHTSCGVLTAAEIRALKLVTPLDEENLQAASYDLTLGSECRMCGEGDDIGKSVKYPKGHDLVIKPLQTVIISTSEEIRLPPNVVGRWDLRVSLSLAGLILQVGPQVEPGYSGPLFGMILNTLNEDMYIHAGQPIATIEFSYTSIIPEKIRNLKVTSLTDYLAQKHIDRNRLSKISVVKALDIRVVKVEESLGIKTRSRRQFIRDIFFMLAGSVAGGVAGAYFSREPEKASQNQTGSDQTPVRGDSVDEADSSRAKSFDSVKG